ncbi:glutathione-regulated potassium-efflux system protein kefc [hydrocarbon metagenome]|uniref:Glutathione-regulated potassium-efflux system protein kefc n=1 Tax=hydrocarbon metagenome TaxID=938273 RepID=A0A0W8E188_9ZZZZ
MTGILAGPYGIGLVKSVHQVESIAEIGVILLLFSIGLEFSFKSLISIKKTILLGGELSGRVYYFIDLFGGSPDGPVS